jgi:hypothetical protein
MERPLAARCIEVWAVVLDQTGLHTLDDVDESGRWSVDSVCSSPVLTVPTREESSKLSSFRNCSVERSASVSANCDERRKEAAARQQHRANAARWLVKGAPNLMQRLPGLPTTPDFVLLDSRDARRKSEMNYG